MQQDSNTEPQTPSTPTHLSKIQSLDRIQSMKEGKKENNYLRGVREDEEM